MSVNTIHENREAVNPAGSVHVHSRRKNEDKGLGNIDRKQGFLRSENRGKLYNIYKNIGFQRKYMLVY